SEMDWKPDAALPPVPCFPGEMNQVFLNIVVNAAHAIEASGKKLPGKITITTSKSEDGFVEIRISDSGTGVPESIRDKIFDPFFTTKGVGKGTGQGLAISRDVVVTKHGGQLHLESVEGEGATFVIRLPMTEPGGEPEMDVGL
ncbi:MAG: HAMP domain-containing histidine kinase, partial [Rhodospirillales bacterium]